MHVQKISILPQQKGLGYGGFCKTQTFKEMCEALLEFLEGWGGGGSKKKSLLWGRYGYFLKLHNIKGNFFQW